MQGEVKEEIQQEEKKGSLGAVLKIAWPSVLESFFTSLVGLVDSLMVSRVGAHAVAAVGLTTQPKFIGLATFFALNVSISALVARRKGEERRKEANQVLSAALVFVILATILVSIVCVAFADPIIRLCGSEAATHDEAVSYFRIIMGFIFFTTISMAVNSAHRGAGNTKITMKTNLTANVINVIFNYLLIGGHFGFPALGIKGAAIATVIGTAVGCVMSILAALKKDTFISLLYIWTERIRPTLQVAKSMFGLGISVLAEQLLIRVGFLATAVMAAKMGTEAFAAHQVAMNLLGLSFSFGDGMQVAAVTLIGQSLGRGSIEMAKKYGNTCQNIGRVIAVVLSLLYFFGAEFYMNLYFEEQNIVTIGIAMLRVMIFIVFFQISQVIYMGCLRGAGDVKFTTTASTISVTFVRTIFSYLFCYAFGFGILGIWYGILSDQLCRFGLTCWRFKSDKWTKIKI